MVGFKLSHGLQVFFISVSLSVVTAVEFVGEAIEELETLDVGVEEQKALDVGICLGVPKGHWNDAINCRDNDTDRNACDSIGGCKWIPLPRCGNGSCIDLNTNDCDTTMFVLGVLVVSGLLVLSCVLGWLIVSCCWCAHCRSKRKAREADRRRVREELQAEIDHLARNFDDDIPDEISVETPDLVKDPEAGQEDDGTDGTEDEVESLEDQPASVVNVQIF